MKHLTDIFFDLDHTLWDFDKNSAISYELIFKALDLPINLEEFLLAYRQINMDLWKLFREDKINKETLRYKRLKDTFTAIGKDVPDAIIHEIADQYIYYLSKQTNLLDGAIELLEYLKPKYKLHIITNGFQEVQVGKLNNTDLIRYFDVVVNSEMAGVKKPNPKIFEMALDMANVKKKNAIMIGDSYEADVLGALDIGLDAICYNYHQDNIPSSIKQVTHLNELKKIF